MSRRVPHRYVSDILNRVGKACLVKTVGETMEPWSNRDHIPTLYTNRSSPSGIFILPPSAFLRYSFWLRLPLSPVLRGPTLAPQLTALAHFPDTCTG